jgi:4'-phosphopantetheinyl transferase
VPVHQIFKNNYSLVGIWRITESEDELQVSAKLSPSDSEVFEQLASAKRRVQWLAVRNLLQNLRPEDAEIEYDSLGRPKFIRNHTFISISHSGMYAAVQISEKHPCGIDIQEISEKMERLYPKFVNAEEESYIRGPLFKEYLNLFWTLKESVFKFYGTDVEFKSQMQVTPFEINHSGTCEILVKRAGEQVLHRLQYHKIDNYYLSFLL